MRPSGARLLALTGVTAGALLASGCSALLAPQPDPSRFYLVSPTIEQGGSATENNVLTLGIGPISLPDYVQRQEIVIRTSPTEVRHSDIDYWAEPLAQNVTRVLGVNLGRLVGTERIFSFPAPGITRTDCQVLVTFLNFEQDTEHHGVLSARWEIRTPGSEAPLATRVTTVTRPPVGAGIDGGVAALSAALGDLSRDIADEIRTRAPER